MDKNEERARIGFNPGANVTISWDGEVLPTVPTMVVVNSNGIFTAIISIPTQTIPGAHNINATDDAGASAETTFTVIDITGPAGPAGEDGEDGTAAPVEGVYASLGIAIVALLLAVFLFLKKK